VINSIRRLVCHRISSTLPGSVVVWEKDATRQTKGPPVIPPSAAVCIVARALPIAKVICFDKLHDLCRVQLLGTMYSYPFYLAEAGMVTFGQCVWHKSQSCAATSHRPRHIFLLRLYLVPWHGRRLDGLLVSPPKSRTGLFCFLYKTDSPAPNSKRRIS
jgi:hypothetical protein